MSYITGQLKGENEERLLKTDEQIVLTEERLDKTEELFEESFEEVENRVVTQKIKLSMH